MGRYAYTRNINTQTLIMDLARGTCLSLHVRISASLAPSELGSNQYLLSFDSEESFWLRWSIGFHNDGTARMKPNDTFRSDPE